MHTHTHTHTHTYTHTYIHAHNDKTNRFFWRIIRRLARKVFADGQFGQPARGPGTGQGHRVALKAKSTATKW